MTTKRRPDLIERNDLIAAVENKKFAISDNTHPYEAIRIQGKHFREVVENAPTVDAVPAVQYKGLYGMYYELREAFIDYVCAGSNNLADYCLNRCPECVDKRGWCITLSDHCKGFNPAEVIPWEEVYGDEDG